MTPTTSTTAHVVPAGENKRKYLHRLLGRTPRRQSGLARGYQPARPGPNPTGSHFFFFLRRSRSPFFWVGSQQAGKTASVSATINTAARVADMPRIPGGAGASSAVVLVVPSISSSLLLGVVALVSRRHTIPFTKTRASFRWEATFVRNSCLGVVVYESVCGALHKRLPRKSGSCGWCAPSRGEEVCILARQHFGLVLPLTSSFER